MECDHKGKPMATHAGFNERYFGKPSVVDKQSEVLEFYKNVCGKCGAIRIDAQIGLEVTPDAYIANLVAVFRECKRILRDDGTLWVNIGSSFVSGIIESQEYILRDDLTAEELEYVYSELAEHFKAQSKAVSDLWETNAPTEQEVSGLLRPGKSAA